MWPVDWAKDQHSLMLKFSEPARFFRFPRLVLSPSIEGECNYIMYGPLRSRSLLVNVVYELEMLADNVIKVTEAYEDFLNIDLQ